MMMTMMMMMSINSQKIDKHVIDNSSYALAQRHAYI